MTRNVVVVGTPRSGTSLAAGIFARQGHHVGSVQRRRYREGDEHNPFGYFEADDVVEHNVSLLRRAGFSSHNTWNFGPVSDEVAHRLATLPIDAEDRRLLASYDARSPWMWKDPRLCYTLAYWGRLLHPERTAVLLLHRSPDAVYQSFQRMGWRSGDEAARADVRCRIEHHLEAARRTLAALSIRHLEIDYAEFLENAEEMAARIGSAVGLSLTGADLNARADLDHSRYARSRASARIRVQLLRLPKPVRRWMRMRVPRRLLAVVFPEWRYVCESSRKRE